MSNYTPIGKFRRHVEEEPKEEESTPFINNRIRKSRAGLKDFRIIIRNLPFDTTTDELRKHFEQLGFIKDIKLPKCKDKRFPDSCAGFAFIQYSSRNSARDAVEQLNFSFFKKRKIAVDFSLSKDSYMSQSLGDSEKKRMLEKASKYVAPSKITNVKAEEDEEENGEADEEENVEADEIVESGGSEFENSESEDAEDEAEDGESESGDDEDAEVEENEDVKKEEMEVVDGTKIKFKRKIKDEDNGDEKPPKKKRTDTALEEGRVIFLRNLDFSMTNETLKASLKKFGEITLAILCKFPGTEQRTGNAFVHFAKKEDADKLLDELQSTGYFIENRLIEGHRAVPREDAAKFNEKRAKMGKDNRNLNLLRVSLIRPGSTQAKGMSEQDAALRKRLIETARVKLKNLHFFVSPKRLAIHNLPFSYSDDDLYNLCMKHATKKAEIRECRIMRKQMGKDQRGRKILGKSKGFGFVEFNEHFDALTCLRNLNNNSTTFSEESRPIVEFSIENLSALNIRKKRLQNPLEPNDADDQLLQRTKAEVSRSGLKSLPKKTGEKIRQRNAGNKKGPTGQKQNLHGVKLNKFKKKGPTGQKQNLYGVKLNKFKKKGMNKRK